MKQKNNRLKVFISGSGHPVILLHGFISTHRYWNDVVDELPETLQVIRPDLLGFGASPKPRKLEYSLQDQIEWLERMLNDLDLSQKPILVGHSMGAVIALAWADKNPANFEKIIISGMPVIADGKLVEQTLGISNMTLGGNKSLMNLAFHVGKGVSYIPKKLAPVLIKNVPKHVAEDTTKHRSYTRQKILLNSYLADKSLELLENIKVPTLCIAADADSLVADLSELQSVANNNQKVDFKLVSGGHQIPLEHPSVIASAIKLATTNKKVKDRL